MSMSRMSIATAPISWGACEIPQWGEQLPWPQVLDEMAASGYAGTELGPPGFLPSDRPTLIRELSSRSLALVGAFCPTTAHRPDDGSWTGPVGPEPASTARRTALETVATLRAAGGAMLVLAEAGDARRAALAGRVPRDGSASFTDDEWARFAEAANGIARAAHGLGVATAFHPHAGSYVETPEEIARLLAETDPVLVGLCLDTGHVAYGGGDPVALARRHGRRVRHVHLKDLRREVLARAIAGGLGLKGAVGQGVFAPLGDGDLDLGGVLDALRDADYAGWLVVEQDVRLGITPGASPLTDARRSREYLREIVGA